MADWTDDKFWKCPSFDPRSKGDDRPEDIYMQVGRALTAWETLEEELCSLFAVVTHAGTTESAVLTRHLFGINESSSHRLAMVKTALILHLSHHWKNPRVSGPYKKLFKTIYTASHRRNEIAHGRVTNVTVVRGDGIPKPSGYFLTAPGYAINRSQPYLDGEWHADDVLPVDRSLYRYRAADIFVLEEKFAFLRTKTRELLLLAAKGEHGLPKIVLDLAKDGLLLRP